MTASSSAPSAPRISYFLRINIYGGFCAGCGEQVDIECGFAQKNRDKRWEIICDGCVRTHGRSVPIVIHGRVTGGETHILTGTSVVSGGSVHDIHRCTTCHGEVAWVRSRKTGRFYLASVTKSMADGSDARRVYDFNPHTCRT